MEVVLSTLNARYQHASFGLRYLMANLKDLQSKAVLLEFTLQQEPQDIVDAILKQNPKIVGFGVYIWNTEQSFKVVSILKAVAPQIRIILGGPEVSYEAEDQPLCALADLVVQGEADFLFYEICKQYLDQGTLPEKKFVRGILPEIKDIKSPYSYYSDEDIKNRVLYVEASRGCPYKCEYCLSSLDKSVRSFELGPFLSEMDTLIQRGARQFKFVDRTFNLSIQTSTTILNFFLERMHLGLFLHFEMVPDRLPEALRDLITKFPAGSLQFEVGIQTWNPEVAKNVSRRQDYTKIHENFEFLTQKTGVHIHADLIVGLPGETLDSFGQGFDAVSELKPHEIQVGILKRLKGTPIIRHDTEWKMVYQNHPPFQILSTRSISYSEVQEMRRFSKFWDLTANSGRLNESLELLEESSRQQGLTSKFLTYRKFFQFLGERHAQMHSIALLSLVESVWIYFTETLKIDRNRARAVLVKDYAEGPMKRSLPRFLEFGEQALNTRTESNTTATHTPKRQRNHQGVASLPQ